MKQLAIFSEGILIDLIVPKSGSNQHYSGKHIHIFNVNGDCRCGMTLKEFKKNQPPARRSNGNKK